MYFPLLVAQFGRSKGLEQTIPMPLSISTATFLSSVNIFANVPQAQGLFMQDELKRVYICDPGIDRIVTYINPNPKVYVLKYDRSGINWVIE